MSTATIDTTTVRRWKRYPEYRRANLDWQHDVPKHWDVKQLKWTVTACQNGVWGDEPTGGSDDIACIRVADFDRTRFLVDASRELTVRSVAESQRRGKVLRPGDLLIEKSGGGELQPVGAVVLYSLDRPAVSSNFVARMPVAEGYSPEFLRYLHAAMYTARVNTRSIKQSIGIQNLDSGAYLDEPAGLPPLAEQQAIAAFLDRETARIDALIGHKERLIALLEEKRQAVISHAVTRGLDPNAKLKDSGIPWLGLVPERWRMTRLKFVAEVQSGITLGKKYDDRELVERPYLRVANVQDGYLDLSEITTIQVPASDVSRHELRPGDVLMTEGGDFDKLGRGYVWEEQIPGCLHQNHVFAVRPNLNRLQPHFLSAMMTSAHGRTYFTFTSQQSTNLASTNATKLGNFPIPLPNLHEQNSILAEIQQQSRAFAHTLDRIRDGIARLQEYRTALISAAVTGQIDVRGEVTS